MANVTKDVAKTDTSIYKYTASMNYILNEEVHYIDSMYIKSIAIDSDYKQMNMPMIFITVVLNRKLIDLMVQNQDTGVIILDIKRAVANSDMPNLYTDYIVDKFIYFIAEDVNKLNKLDDEKAQSNEEYTGENDDFKVTTLGLLSLDHVNNNKKTVNGIINGKLSSIMYYLTGHLPILIEPPTKNVNMTNKFLPPMNSVSKALDYINTINVLYSTPYRFFIDFGCSYLLSSSGKAVKRKGENISTVLITLRNTYDEGSKLQGMTVNESQSMYLVDIDGLDCELSDSHISEKSYSKITAATTNGSTTNGNLNNRSKDSVVNEKTKTIRLVNDNSGLLDNITSSLNTSAVQLLVQKVDVDASVFTMNKEYVVKADEVYNTENYNGKYILSRKRELYIREDEDFIVNVMLLLERIPDGK